MDTSDPRERAQSRQDQSIFPPAIQPGGVYTRRQLQHNLNISDKTFAKWLNAGLKPIPNTGTANALFFADDVLKFFRVLQATGA